jgi:hypothetical protein
MNQPPVRMHVPTAGGNRIFQTENSYRFEKNHRARGTVSYRIHPLGQNKEYKNFSGQSSSNIIPVDFVLVKQRKTTIARIAVSAISSLRLLLYEKYSYATDVTWEMAVGAVKGLAEKAMHYEN